MIMHVTRRIDVCSSF